ncbi:MAG: hypothetical protein AB7F43_01130 [Bacteriovoracia bacterium]
MKIKQILLAFVLILVPLHLMSAEIPRRSVSVIVPESRLPSEVLNEEILEKPKSQLFVGASSWVPEWNEESRLRNTKAYRRSSIPRLDFSLVKSVEFLQFGWGSFAPKFGLGFMSLTRTGDLTKNGQTQTYDQNASIFIGSIGFQFVPTILTGQFWHLSLSACVTPVFAVTERSVLSEGTTKTGFGGDFQLMGFVDPGWIWNQTTGYNITVGGGQTLGKFGSDRLSDTYLSGGLSWSI